MAQEMHFSNLGLGNALAVAYDLYSDPNSQQQMMYTHIPVSMSTVQSTNGARTTTSAPLTQYLIQPSSGDCQTFSYLNPIPTAPVGSRIQLQTTSGASSFVPVAAASTFSAPQYDGGTNIYTTTSAGTVILNGQSSTSSSCVSPTSNNSLENCSFNSNPANLSCSSQVSTPKSTKTHISRANVANGSSSGSDDGMYDISEEEIQEIDDSLANNEEVIKSRHWKYYIETNEWTRATCALMACLFSREQMANSTVLGRGGAQRERLPTNLVAYVVTKIRRRFGKPAAAVRARMAQKCKDERRFGRNPANAIAVIGKTGRGSAVPNGASPSVALKRQFKSEEPLNNGKRKLSTEPQMTFSIGSPTLTLGAATGHSTILLSPSHPGSGTPLLIPASFGSPTGATLLSTGDANNNTTILNGSAIQLTAAGCTATQPILYQNDSTSNTGTTFMLNGQLYHQPSVSTGTQPIFIPQQAFQTTGNTTATTGGSPVHQNLVLLPTGHCIVNANPQPGTPSARISSPIPQVGSPTAFVVATANSTHQPSSFARL